MLSWHCLLGLLAGWLAGWLICLLVRCCEVAGWAGWGLALLPLAVLLV